MCNSLKIVPIIVNWANKVASYVVANPIFLLPIGRKLFFWFIMHVDPFRNCGFETACVVTMCVTSACLQLNSG
jgi:hypothetical protein